MIDLEAIDHVLTAEEPLGPVELARRLGIRSASASVLVDRLVEARHLARVPGPGRRPAHPASWPPTTPDTRRCGP